MQQGARKDRKSPRIVGILQERPSNAVHHGDSLALIAVARTVALQRMQQGARNARRDWTRQAKKPTKSVGSQWALSNSEWASENAARSCGG
jgi:hypothetical protein